MTIRRCPKCKSDERNNRNMVMMINECGHPLCRNCVETIFARNSSKCTYDGCGRMLKKNNFREQLFDDPRIDRENFIRKRLSKTFNLNETNFPTLRAFNDYLEKVEDIVFKLANDIDVEDTEAEVKQFKADHSEEIERNRKFITPDDKWINDCLADDMSRLKNRQAETEEEARNISKKVDPNSKTIIDQLRETDLPAEVILDRQRKIQIEAEMAEKEKAESKKQEKLDRFTQSFHGLLRRNGTAYIHKNPTLQINGPRIPSATEIEKGGYLAHICKSTIAGVAGGYVQQIGVSRAIFDAHQGMFDL